MPRSVGASGSAGGMNTQPSAENDGFESEYDIQVTILRNGVEIGFCAALGDTIDHAAYGIGTILQRREWETADGMPDPSEVDR